MIYLDHAATTPVPEEVAHAVYDTLVSGWGNPSSQYPIGKQARDAVAAARETIAAALGCKSEQFVFTSCGSESDNWAVRLALHQNRHAGKHIITTAVEHSAILETCKVLEQEGCSVTYLKPDKNGDITASQVESALRDDTALVTMMLVNNETGCIFPVAEVAQLLKAKKSRALLHTDAVQAFLKIPFRADTLGADLISVSAHKLGAPKGIGGLYLGERIRAPKPLIFGGGQESGLRSGTEATGQIAGFAKAVELRADHLDDKARPRRRHQGLRRGKAPRARRRRPHRRRDRAAHPVDLARRLPVGECRYGTWRTGHLHLGRLRLPSRAAEPRLPRDGP